MTSQAELGPSECDRWEYRGDRSKLPRRDYARTALIATRFVNITQETLSTFLMEYHDVLRAVPNAQDDKLHYWRRPIGPNSDYARRTFLLNAAALLRQAWHGRPHEAVDHIFKSGVLGERDQQQGGLALIEPARTGQLDLHRDEYIFKPRDLLDQISSCILVAHRRGLLKKCEGQECQTLFVVAREKRQTLCPSCGLESKKRSKLRSWHRHKGEWRKR